MSIINQLATSLNRRDEIPNQELAKQIAKEKNTIALDEIVAHLHDKNKDIANDCIKVCYETGYINPTLIAKYATDFIQLLRHKNNRIQWGAMIAIDVITLEKPNIIYQSLPEIVNSADNGSVITNDHCVQILLKLCTIPQYYDDCFSLAFERLLKSPMNQFPKYAEETAKVVKSEHKNKLATLLKNRLTEVEKETQQKRLEKVLKKLL